ncbi:hypothetical protein CIP107507_01861 [Corynebacterium diphtheriae]|nr:hypothetical protein CIP107507_01861 [Corynebacterium diphtheriae]CAB0872465.1 hypothetical protein FRC0376_02081 [Corynebacterium diphtheriae]CAB1045029.1 hypothetical protein FRC0549_01819 [Corynebacterium diphtheriae]
MFKRSLASLAAVVVASGAVVAPANAVTVEINDNNTCTIKLTAEEARLTNLKQTVTADKQLATLLKTQYGVKQLSALHTKIENAKKELAKLKPHSQKSESLRRELEENEKKFTAYENLSNALDACTNGRNYDSNNPERPSEPDPNNPERPSEPDPNNPERERALPSTNGAVIGVIVAVLGILVAALPVIKSMLPAQLRALLP